MFFVRLEKLEELTVLIYFKVTTQVGLCIVNETDGDRLVRPSHNDDSTLQGYYVLCSSGL